MAAFHPPPPPLILPPVEPITLDYGADEPLVLEPLEGGATAFAAPRGVIGAEARRLVMEAVTAPLHGPPLSAHTESTRVERGSARQASPRDARAPRGA